MKRTTKFPALLGLWFVLYPLFPLAAQEFPFSGRWALNREKTGMPGLPDITIEISLAGGVINYRKTVKDPRNVWVTDMAMAADGKEGTYTDFNGNRLKCAAWFRGGDLVLAYQSRPMRNGQWVVMDAKDEHSVSPDGKSLSIAHSETWEGQAREFPRPMVFDRVGDESGKGQVMDQSDRFHENFMGWRKDRGI